MNVRRGTRLSAVPLLCAALLAGAAACGGGGSGGGQDRNALEVQLGKGPFKDYEHRLVGKDGTPLGPKEARHRLDCYADVLLAYGGKADVAAYERTGEGYALIGIGKPAEFKREADACLGKENVSGYVPPYPAAALG
jgi:hypothetical protein